MKDLWLVWEPEHDYTEIQDGGSPEDAVSHYLLNSVNKPKELIVINIADLHDVIDKTHDKVTTMIPKEREVTKIETETTWEKVRK